MDTPLIIRKNARAKHVSITVRPDGTVTVTQPPRISRFLVDLFIRSRRAWIEEKVAYFKNHPKALSTPRRGTRAEYLKHKEAARVLVHNRLRYFSGLYGYQYNSVSIKNLTSRWGSCSIRRNLNFNYKILFLTPEQQDYIIVHELCHLAEMNHGSKFWALVQKQIPNYLEIRRTIRKFDL
jgi:predicted metal-dependent hydrolase